METGGATSPHMDTKPSLKGPWHTLGWRGKAVPSARVHPDGLLQSQLCRGHQKGQMFGKQDK